jgi:hypothetical protein
MIWIGYRHCLTTFEMEVSASFFEKKEAKKLLLLGALAGRLPQPSVNKSFLLLFFKKEALPSFGA